MINRGRIRFYAIDRLPHWVTKHIRIQKMSAQDVPGFIAVTTTAGLPISYQVCRNPLSNVHSHGILSTDLGRLVGPKVYPSP